MSIGGLLYVSELHFQVIYSILSSHVGKIILKNERIQKERTEARMTDKELIEQLKQQLKQKDIVSLTAYIENLLSINILIWNVKSL